jgi:hypothetical protein
MIKYITDNVKDKKVIDIVTSNNNFPMYKDLEPYKQYGSETISQLHDIVLLLFSGLKNVLDKKEEELRMHKLKNDIGLNIDNFIQTFQFDNIVLEQKLSLFISYMEFFHKMHIKYLKRFTSKMNLFSSQIDHDIKIDSTSKSKERRRSMIDEFKHDNIGATLMHQLTDSISGGVSDSENGTNGSRSCSSPDIKEKASSPDSSIEKNEAVLFPQGCTDYDNPTTQEVVHIEMDVDPEDDGKDHIPPCFHNEEEHGKDDDSTITNEDVRIRRRLSSTPGGQIIHKTLRYKVVFSAGAFVRQDASYDKDVKKVGTIDKDDIVESSSMFPRESVLHESGELVTWVKLLSPVVGWVPLINHKGQNVIELIEEIDDSVDDVEINTVASKLLENVVDTIVDETAPPKNDL